MAKFAIFGKDGKGSYLFIVEAERHFAATSKIRDSGFNGYIDHNSHDVDEIFTIDTKINIKEKYASVRFDNLKSS